MKLTWTWFVCNKVRVRNIFFKNGIIQVYRKYNAFVKSIIILYMRDY